MCRSVENSLNLWTNGMETVVSVETTVVTDQCVESAVLPARTQHGEALFNFLSLLLFPIFRSVFFLKTEIYPYWRDAWMHSNESVAEAQWTTESHIKSTSSFKFKHVKTQVPFQDTIDKCKTSLVGRTSLPFIFWVIRKAASMSTILTKKKAWLKIDKRKGAVAEKRGWAFLSQMPMVSCYAPAQRNATLIVRRGERKSRCFGNSRLISASVKGTVGEHCMWPYT